jgi:DNA helicase-2/ATP-dependent DNA helicase PcrA
MIDEKKILEGLNPSQKEAVIAENSPLLVLAGAGSGKTRILTSRIAHLILKGVPSYNILAVTFTNKAAQEMNSRVLRLVDQKVWVSTFHSSCLKILRSEGQHIELDPSFNIYDDSDQLTLIKACLQELNMNEKQMHPKGIRERIQRAKDYLMSPYQYAERAEDLYEESVSKVYKRYEEKMKRLNALDFGDLIMKTVLLFDRSEAVLLNWQNRFQHILIDEYQDTNHAQYRWVNQLAAKRRQVTVVGDPDQSIYAWRGADIKNILNFEKDYPDCQIIKMEQNYRSTANILDAANEIIQYNQMRRPKALWTEQEAGEKISVFQASDERAEAQYVVDQVTQRQKQGVTLADQVIFYRTHAQSRVIEDSLRKHNIPYKIVGGVRFYDRKEIKDLVGYLKVMSNTNDDINLKRILNVPTRGIGKKAIETLEAYAQASNVSLYEAIRQCPHFENLQPKAKKSIASFYHMMEEFRHEIKRSSVSSLLQYVLDKTLYIEHLSAEKTAEAQERIQNIEEFFSVIYEFEEENTEDPSLLNFLESISLMTNLDSWDNGTNILTMMTIHMAKGLEFPHVYMIGMEEGIFPHSNSNTNDQADMEEERRLCYVGITRGKKKVHLIFARQRRLFGATQFNLPSRFLNEIPAELIQQENAFGRKPIGRSSDNDDIDDLIYDDIFMDDNDDEVKNRILFD